MRDGWKPYFDGRKFKQHPSGFTVIVPESYEFNTSFHCPVCSMLLTSADDTQYYRELEACYACGLKWADPDRERWKNGWRPAAEDVESEVKIRKSIPLSVNLDAFKR